MLTITGSNSQTNLPGTRGTNTPDELAKQRTQNTLNGNNPKFEELKRFLADKNSYLSLQSTGGAIGPRIYIWELDKLITNELIEICYRIENIMSKGKSKNHDTDLRREFITKLTERLEALGISYKLKLLKKGNILIPIPNSNQ